MKSIFEKYTSNVKIRINVECNNNVTYKFESIDECFEYFNNFPYRIIKMEIEALFDERYNCNSVTIAFDNTQKASVKTNYRFDSSDDYLAMKENVELCLKNFRLNYRLLSVVPITSILLTCVFVCICLYTNTHNIVFPVNIQKTIMYMWLIGTIVTFLPVVPALDRMKRNIFPYIEFAIGQNELIENKYSRIRDILIVTVLLSLIVGVIVNFISSFLF